MFATSCGRPVGTHGDLSTFSFHETKNVTCGEGGALLVNRADWWDRALIVREKGTDRTRSCSGEVDKYTWVDRGSSYLLADPLAAIVLAQVEFVDVIQARRKEAWLRYADELVDWAAKVGAQLPTDVTAHDTSPYHLYAMLLADNETRDRFLAYCQRAARHVGVPLPPAARVARRTRARARRGVPGDRRRVGPARPASALLRHHPRGGRAGDRSRDRLPRVSHEYLAVASVSVVVPVYNNEASLDELVERLTAVLEPRDAPYEIVLVDDGSADDSWKIIMRNARADDRVVGLHLSRNFGQQPATRAGLQRASGDITVLMDADLQDRPEEIPRHDRCADRRRRHRRHHLESRQDRSARAPELPHLPPPVLGDRRHPPAPQPRYLPRCSPATSATRCSPTPSRPPCTAR